MIRKALIVVPASVALLLAGCSSSGKTAQTLTPAATATIVGTAPAAPASTAAANLSAELLTVNDLPAGWTSTSPSSSSGGVTSCAALNSRPWQALPERSEADFQASQIGPFLAEKLDAGSGAQISQAWSAFATATAQCRTFTSKNSSGGTDSYTLQALSFPSYGDQTYAFAVTLSASGISASGDIVIVRKGTALVQIIAIGIPDVPVATVEQATSAAVARVK